MMRLGQAEFDLSVMSGFLGFTSSHHIINCDETGDLSGIFGLSRQLGLELLTHTSEALAEWYQNGSQSILGTSSFRPSTSSSLIVLLQHNPCLFQFCPLGGSSAWRG